MRKKPSPAEGSIRKKILALGFVCLLVVMLVTSFFGKKGVMDLHLARRRCLELEEQVRVLEGRRAGLEKEIHELRDDPRAVEKEAREKLGLIKPGEKVVLIPPRKK